MYNLTDLQTFVSIVDNNSIHGAAAAQQVSVATVSLRLSKLEKALSTVLVFRDSRKLELSSAGEVFYQRVCAILEALRDAEYQIGARRSSISGVLRVTMPPWIFSKFVMPRLMEFEQQYPDLKLEFLINDQFVNVVEDKQDVAVRVGSLSDSAMLARKLCDNHRILCASPLYLERYGTPDSLARLAEHRWVVLPWQRQLKMQESGKVRTFNVDARFTVSNSDYMTQALLAGHGIGIKSYIAIREALQSGSLVEVLPGMLASGEAPVWFLKPQNSLTTRKTEAFFDFMQSVFDAELANENP
ncbi:MAG: LysR substrate-binding domain-containing protein [Pseudomonadota bacterium]|nr:transcriptional regulator [Alteromonadaceae bacterium]MDY6928240.1 LysR substrate-binding domain-containing protein [Pseudomonadota bacterium]RPH16863.1 MAG: LysR family transcriptional regulator [Alteromonadaceae bacterium TMED7]|tara:strand:- start:1332 stop:2231 length:900 start_codon:yes stop_codon:yes gene_type:complete